MNQVPKMGRVVVYVLSGVDAQVIAARRPIGYNGNPVCAGDEFPMIITRVWSPSIVNGQVILDGDDSYWVTSAEISHDPAHRRWHWPVLDKQLPLPLGSDT